MNAENINSEIMHEAYNILHSKGLYSILKKLGEPIVSGSYWLEMMTWRDLDIYVAIDSLSQDSFFDVGKEISVCLRPAKMNFRNEFIGKTPHLPKGLYWGVHTNLFNQSWKIDIWGMEIDEVRRKQKALEKLKVQMDQSKRKVILDLKTQLHAHPKYRREFFSVDIYNAVIDGKVHAIDDFKVWLLVKNGLKL